MYAGLVLSHPKNHMPTDASSPRPTGVNDGSQTSGPMKEDVEMTTIAVAPAPGGAAANDAIHVSIAPQLETHDAEGELRESNHYVAPVSSLSSA